MTTAAPSEIRTPAALLGGAALLLSSASLIPLFVDLRWLPTVFAVTVAVVLTGIALRSAGAAVAVVAAVQMLVVVVLATVLFTRSGVLGFLPGPAAVADLRGLLAGAGSQIRSERVPVVATVQLEVLLVLSVGAAAVVMDVLVAGVLAPAGAGLVLLTMVAVPASLFDGLLPWWSFVLGAAALVLLLVADGEQRATRLGPAAGPGGLRSPALLGVVAAAVIVGLAGGTAVLGVGTEGRLSGVGGGSGVGLNPFTQLRGQLDQPNTTDLFSVQGLSTPTYLRALSLDTYVANRGWLLDRASPDEPVTASLDTREVRGRQVDVRVVPDRYTDRWLPTPGTPQQIRATVATLARYNYDRALGTVFTDDSRPLPRYRVRALVPTADATVLRTAGTPSIAEQGAPDQRFYATAGIDAEITRITDDIVAPGTDPLDAAVLLTDYFRDPANGFVYDLETAQQDSGSGSDALVEFLTTGKRGFCEQFASAMAAMLRTQGIPTRVGVGFTAGQGDAVSRQVTTDDAHAWVEVYFSGIGWVQFDPTPLNDGRGVVPDYVTQAQQQQQDRNAPSAAPTTAPTAAEPTPGAIRDRGSPDQDPGAAADAQDATTAGSGVPAWIWQLGLGVTVLVAAVGSAPRLLRLLRRRRRLDDGGVVAAWDEALDTLGDHGTVLRSSETPRQTARRATAELGLDSDGAAALTDLVGGVERSWYAADPRSGGSGQAARQSIDSLRRSVASATPLRIRDRWWPRSLQRSVGASSVDGDAQLQRTE